MSRGLGILQNSLLSHLKTVSLPISENELLWKVAESEDKIRKIPYSEIYTEGSIHNSFYKSFRRALSNLIKNGIIDLEPSAKFTSLDDFIKYYPYKTTNNLIKEMRIDFLPFIKEFVDLHVYDLQFSNHQVETHNLKEFLEANPEEYNDCAKKWLRIRVKFINLLKGENDKTISSILKLLAKGEQSFVDSKISVDEHSAAISKTLFTTLGEGNTEFLKLSTEFKDFLNKCIYGHKYLHDLFKNQLYLVAIFTRGVKPSLTSLFKEALLRKFPEQINSLPNTKIADPDKKIKEGTVFFSTSFEEDIIDPIVDKLILRDAFSEFKFIRGISPQL